MFLETNIKTFDTLIHLKNLKNYKVPDVRNILWKLKAAKYSFQKLVQENILKLVVPSKNEVTDELKVKLYLINYLDFKNLRNSNKTCSNDFHY